MTDAEDFDCLKLAFEGAPLIVKNASGQEYKQFSSKAGELRKNIAMTKRRNSLGNEEQPQPQQRVAHPSQEILYQLVEQATEHGKPSNSLYEAKAGVSGALLRIHKDHDPIAELQKMSGFSKIMKQLETHLKTADGGVMTVQEPPKKAKIFKIMKAHLDPSLFTQMLLPKAEWTSCLYNPAFTSDPWKPSSC